MVQFCPRCGVRNTTREPLCGRCGGKLYGLFVPGAGRVECGVCTAANPPNADYCVRCGRQIGEQLGELSVAASAQRVRTGGDEAPAGSRRTAEAVGPRRSRRGAPTVVASMALPSGAEPRARGLGCFGAIAGMAALGLAGLFAVGQDLVQRPSLSAAPRPEIVVVEELPAPPSGVVVVASRSGGGTLALPPATPVPRAAPVGAVAPSPTSGAAASPAASGTPSSAPPRAGNGPPAPTGGAGATGAPSAADGGGVRGPAAAPLGPDGTARQGDLVFTLTALELGPGPAGGVRVVVTAEVANAGRAPLAYDAAWARLTALGGTTTHQPIPASAAARGALQADEQTTMRFAFDLPADHGRLALEYGGAAIALGDPPLRTIRLLPVAQ